MIHTRELTNQPWYGYNYTMIERNITRALVEAMADTPVVLVHGARQTGKSTLVQWFASQHGGRYLTLDDATILSAAAGDPYGFVASFDVPVILDEVQRAPELFRAIKVIVDRNRQPGRFLLTGSADVLLLPRLSESLAGRMEILTLWPFAESEVLGNRRSFVDTLFVETAVPEAPSSWTRQVLLEHLLMGGFPEARIRGESHRRSAWFGAYITTILQRDVRELSNIENLPLLPRLLRLLAARSMSLMNHAEVSRALGLPQSTLKRYMALLEATFLVQSLPPWSANLGKRLVKAPKLMLCDTGLMAWLLGVDSAEAIPDHILGALLENYAAMELTKHLGWSQTRAILYHFRERTGKEVDLLLENSAGRVVGIEVKSAGSVTRQDFKHLRFLRDQLGDRFLRGVVLYTGSETISFDAQLIAMPVSAIH